MKRSFNVESVATMVGLTLLTGAYLLAVYLPGRRATDRLHHRIERIEARIRNVPQRLRELESLQSDLAEIEAFVSRSRPLLADDPRADHVVERIARLAERTGAAVSRLEPLEAERRATYDRLPFRLDLHASYPALLRFVRELEAEERLVTVENLSVQASEDGSAGTTESRVEFSVYVRRDGTADSPEKSGSEA